MLFRSWSVLAKGDGNEANTAIERRPVLRSAYLDGYSSVHRWPEGDLQVSEFSECRGPVSMPFFLYLYRWPQIWLLGRTKGHVVEGKDRGEIRVSLRKI